MLPLLAHSLYSRIKGQKCYGFRLCLDCLLQDSTPQFPLVFLGLKKETPHGSSCYQPHPSLSSITQTQELHCLHIINNILKM